MNHLTKNKIIVYLATIFLVGGITGGVLGWTRAQERWSHPPDGKTICDHVLLRLQSELKLTPEQVRQIDPILEKRAKQMDAIHSRTIKEIEALIRNSNEEIASVLTPEQQQKLKQMEREREEFFRKRSRHGPPRGAPGPGGNGP
ncbi:MAG: hypothetical protein DME19_20285 [Verrucomicrobia bacterium]|nr:MAG: hypothetical protein DME19_20285 [Verrucomicrobiota bacterium]